jgi:hypothetical protein
VKVDGGERFTVLVDPSLAHGQYRVGGNVLYVHCRECLTTAVEALNDGQRPEDRCVFIPSGKGVSA